MLGGYWHRVLRIDLSGGTVRTEELSEVIARDYVGGSGLGARILYDETGKDTDPLGPDNKMVFAPGPFAGTVVPGSSRFAVCARSPKTGIWGEANAAGHWGAEFKSTGFDAIVVEGRSTEPVYVYVEDGRAEVCGARDVWGSDTYETEAELRRQYGQDSRVIAIGPAGEKLVKCACIIGEGRDGRAAARTGMGAVMGSKKLKAIVVKGTNRPPVAREESLRRFAREIFTRLAASSEPMRKYGTPRGVVSYEALGNLPLKNWRQGTWPDGASRISGQVYTDVLGTKPYHCRGCPVGCGRDLTIDEPGFEVHGAGPEYEAVASLGSNCLIDDPKVIARANEVCNRLGIDTISAGAAVAFTMEAYEKGLVTREDLGGVEATWGNPDALLKLVEMIGTATGFGRVLGEGTLHAARVIGGIAEEFAIHVKGLEPSLHDPRAFVSMGLGYATGNRGADHLQGCTHWYESSLTAPELGFDKPLDRFSVERKGQLVATMQNVMSLMDALVQCKFLLSVGLTATEILSFYNDVTGEDCDLPGLLRKGERIFNLKRLYNARLGISRKDDRLPPRLLCQPRGSGASGQNLPFLGRMLADYYSVRRWSEDGLPTQELTAELGL